MKEPDEFTKEREHYEEMIKQNNIIIGKLRKEGDPKKNKEVFAIESKIEETEHNIARLEKILAEMRASPPAE
jgi:ferritin-like metal-binding protein YciE